MFETRLAHPDEIRTAVRVVVSSHRAAPASELEGQVDALLEWMSGSAYPPRHAHSLVLDGGRPISACLCFDTAGRVGMLYLPHVPSNASPTSDVGRAVQCVLDTAADRELNFVQVVCEPTAQAERRLLSALGFRRLAVLEYMERSTVPAPPDAHGPGNLKWRSYVHADARRFATAISATYRDSLDCPALSGLRSIEDVVASHRATGEYLAEHWYLAEIDGADAGVLILAGSPMRSALEIAYMGVAPAYRGQRLGMAMLQKALTVARARRVETLVLAVDASNEPAVRVYRDFGFARVTTREAWYYPVTRAGSAPANGALSTTVHADTP